MPKEIERKFLVSGTGWRKHADRGKAIRQAYLALTDAMSIRVRIVGNTKGDLTFRASSGFDTFYLARGSLIWNPGTLKVAAEWLLDGPALLGSALRPGNDL
jgi:hypothetical protein